MTTGHHQHSQITQTLSCPFFGSNHESVTINSDQIKPCYYTLPTHRDCYQPAFALTQLKAYSNWNTIPGKHQRNMLRVLIFIILTCMDWWMKSMSKNFSCWCNRTTCQLVNCKQCTNSPADCELSFCICFSFFFYLIDSKTRFRMLRMRSSSPTATVTETAHCSTLLDFLSYWNMSLSSSHLTLCL